jgi:DNA-binding transcriptional MerR regulator
MMPFNRLSTCKIARMVGCHPNTVRLYELWGYISPVPRSPTGYRLFTEIHLDQMCFARTLFNSGWSGKIIRRSALALVRLSASGDLNEALEAAARHLALVQAEITQAETAAQYLQHWADGTPLEPGGASFTTRPVAALLNVTVDTLRTWERSALIQPPRAANGYRLYGPVEIGRLQVIRMLRNAGYSTMAILRMILQLDQGNSRNLRRVLDTPRPDEDVLYAADHWLSTLADQEQRAMVAITLLKDRLKKG